ncbi:MAG: conjugative transposon protein TraN [Prevotellaceae bacterium]|jgi:hypothetical protein|nr:conjugative transposon protein TraN [Prevotellaceae bacterium]
MKKYQREKKKLFVAMVSVLLALALAPQVQAQDVSQTVFLNKKNLVYVIFDGEIVDIIYDSDVVQDERPVKRKDMVGLRLLPAADTTPVGCMVELEGSRQQHLWLQLSDNIAPVVRVGRAAVRDTPPVAAAAGLGLKVTPDADVKSKAQLLSDTERHQLLNGDSLATAGRNAQLPETMKIKASALLLKKPTVYQLGASKGDVSILPQAIGVDATHLYLCVEATNTSKVDYYIDLQGFQAHFKRKGLAAAATGKEYMQPVGSYNEPGVLRAGQRYTYIIIYELFTLKKNQALEFFIRETNGGRNIDVEVPSKYLYENTYQL